MTANTHEVFLLLQRLFRVPPVPGKNIPYTRVNHNKYMVTDNAAYISELISSRIEGSFCHNLCQLASVPFFIESDEVSKNWSEFSLPSSPYPPPPPPPPLPSSHLQLVSRLLE